jgi:hypothetical protein
MPNAITPTGIETATQAELVAQFTAAFQTIYGADINLDSSSPDGQMMMIFIQSVLDLEDLITQVYNQFDPDNAIGVVLDQRVAINGIQRQAGTFTIINITVATSQSVNLYGLDQTVQPVFTVSDNTGNQFELVTTHLGFNPGAGGSALVFQAAVPGAFSPAPNSITVPVTIILGVTSVNNPTAATSVGINEETDAALKVRRQQSVSLASQGYLSGLLAALKNLTGMVAAFVYENNTNSVNTDGVPGHSIWVIVSGTAAAADIAQAIYTKRNAGCGMYGTTTYIITQADGSLFTVSWDGVVTENLFVKFNVSSINGIGVPNIAAIRAGLVSSLIPGVAEEVNINELATLVQAIDPNSLVTSAGFDTSSGGSFADNVLTPSAKNKQFAVSAPNIIILPMILVAATGRQVVSGGSVVSTATVANGGSTLNFSTLGGYGTDHSGTVPHLTYTILSSTGGGSSIVSATGVYTSGAAGTDVVRVTDALGNTANCTVTVT